MVVLLGMAGCGGTKRVQCYPGGRLSPALLSLIYSNDRATLASVDGQPVDSGDGDYVYELQPGFHRITMKLRGHGPGGTARFEYDFRPDRRYGFTVTETRGGSGWLPDWEASLADYDTGAVVATALP
jgi:hypothetical protein